MNGSEVYEATGIGNINKSSETFTPSCKQNVETNEMSAMNVSVDEDTLMQALNITKSTRKKVRARKFHAPVPFDKEGQIQKEPKSDKNSRMHAFIPGNADDVLKDMFTVGKCYIIRKFVIQAYKPDDKFLCLTNDLQLVFSKDTQMKEIEETTCGIETNAFDLYDHSELMKLTKQITHLAGGIQCYINYNHYTVMQLRQKLTQPAFQQEMYAMDKHAEVKILNVARIISMGKEYIMMGEDRSFPSELKALVNRKYTIKLTIKEFNVVHKATTYLATNICAAFIDPNQHLIDAKAWINQQLSPRHDVKSYLSLSTNKIETQSMSPVQKKE
ncbi:hypothetical protein AgCh_029837 [Apium graveolens]